MRGRLRGPDGLHNITEIMQINLSIFMTFRPTNPDPSLAPLPEIAIQVYSTVPLNLDSGADPTALCQYLSSQIFEYPTKTPSFEIYSPQPDAFACVEHQRREILHRKTHRLGEDFFPGIAKVAPNDQDRLLQGFLLVITPYSFRVNTRPNYEAESGPLWVTFNRSFPLRANVDLRSRIECFTLNEFDLSVIADECEVFSEREELVVKKCRKIADACQELSRPIGPSHRDIMGFEFDYCLNEDEADPSLFSQPLPLEIVDSLREKANSLPYEEFDIQLPSEGTVVITSTPTATSPEPDLQYIIHIAFPHKKLGLELMPIAKAFTAAVIDNLPQGKTINFEFQLVQKNPISRSRLLLNHE